ncbi:MAG: alpha/beta hydrolase [Gemmatimonadota bacterium]
MRTRLWWTGAILLLVPLLLLVDRQRNRAQPYQAEWLQAGDGHVRALRTGAGDTTLLLLHGYGESLLAFRSEVEALASHYSILAIDLPGSGLSENPRGSHGLDSTVARVSDLIDRWTTGPIVAIGHSMGGEVAAGLALARPDRVTGLVLIATAGYEINFGIGKEPLSPAERRLAGWSLRARDLLVPVEAPDWLRDPPDMPESAGAASIARNAAAEILRDFDFTALRNRFRDIRQPTLLIWGGLDPLIPLEIGRQVAAAIPRSRLVVLGNSWHRPHVEQPDRVVQEIREFLTPNRK